ncbi:cytochrome c biogenesis protein CcsA [Cytophagaceae bacterium DM2B3-1]|uniref:Heme exporter protein C n=2 Tax=Xanthocytophaga TaxID=3078918 RepID=A0AAE3QU45_9BACT|nr:MULTISPECIES: cytochrome c biogenesis protein CcsA [Xanthocytophaga]MDJ1469862.1 cytochrome c biogenesis protein CcsA [Xanthocytophaga flavus]MDJ1483265.1 cytochrome c biogenesis protein CcsA [Xanthocytophaga flavus]MDJ1494374.1 cytochrome c biogenesis protein CcsA [Xanthocytophaga flavus]MDJ1503213.1 cytochrome c biogenesis protein CcsA [Xanthocytophaga agilis]
MIALFYKSWWKVLTVILLLYTILGGFLMPVPKLPILHETIRNMNFHVALWFAMMIILTFSVVYSIRYLRNPTPQNDDFAVETANVGIVIGMLGITTGSIWARFTWGDWWVQDPKLNGAAVAMLIYLAYLILRGSLPDQQQRARISAIYNIFAYGMLIPLLYILPRLKGVDSLHPGQGGNPGFSAYDLDNNLRKVFYPAVFGWTLLGLWIASLRIRIRMVEHTLSEKMAVNG